MFGLKRRAHGDPLRLINRLPYIRDNFNYSLRLVVLSSSLLLLGLHYFACALWLVLRVQVRKLCYSCAWLCLEYSLQWRELALVLLSVPVLSPRFVLSR